MKIAFIQPPALIAVDNYSTITQPPLGIAYLAAAIRQNHHEVYVIDAVGAAVKQIRPWPLRKKRLLQGLTFEEILSRIQDNTDVICISCMFTHAWPMVRQLIHEIKSAFPHVKLIAGGEHITSMYDTVLKQAPVDVCCLGEGESTIVDLINAFQHDTSDYAHINGLAFRSRSGDIIKTCRRERIGNPDDLPWPAWDLLDPMAYAQTEVYQGPTAGRSMPMLATRGCPFECTFCSSKNMWTQAWKARDPVKVVDEIEHYIKTYSANDFQFQDLTAIIRKDWIIAFCKEVIQRNLKITWLLPAGTRSEAVDAEVASYLMRSGCQHITYAPESGSERILKSIKKKVKLERMETSAKACMKAGMTVCLFTILGFPEEEMSDIKQTIKWLRRMAKIGVHEVSVSTFVPLPGTALFDVVKQQRPFEIDDEYCHWMTGATSLMTVRSWNTRVSDGKLLFYKLWAIFQFYSLSYFYYPDRLWKLIRNIFMKRQETKVDRVIREFLIKIPLAFKLSRAPKFQK